MEREGFDGVVFAGGGCRCFWQAGFWSTAAPVLGLAPRAVAAVSAGSAFACAALGGVIEAVLADFLRRTAANRRNAYPGNLLRRRPVFPHEAMYRGAILASLNDEVLARLRAGPELRVLIAHPPAERALAAILVAGLAAYRLERVARGNVHPRWARRLGFRPLVIPVSSCATAEDLADLILHSSCTPPLTPLFRRAGRVVVDGGIVEPVPAELLADCERTLVLLTRRHRPELLPRSPRRLYVQPSQPVPVAMWDYANPAAIQATFDLGRRDGEAFARGR